MWKRKDKRPADKGCDSDSDLQGGMPEIRAAGGGEGTCPSTRGQNDKGSDCEGVELTDEPIELAVMDSENDCPALSPMTSKMLGKPRSAFKQRELFAIKQWRDSGGDIARYREIVNNDPLMEALLYTETVREAIDHLATMGEASPLIVSKEELAVRTSFIVRDSKAGKSMQLSAGEDLARLQGYYPDKGTGGAPIQINIVNDLGSE